MRKLLLIITLIPNIAHAQPNLCNRGIVEREIFLSCLEKTKSSVTSANDDEDTDDTIEACRKSSAWIAIDTCKEEK